MTRKLMVVLAAVLLTTGAWASTETVLWNFNPSNGDAGNPFANNLIFDGVNYYGVTWEGGQTSGCFNGCGTVFELSPGTSGWTETLLYAFNPVNGSDGSNPLGGLIRDQQGNLYGATYFGGGSTNCQNGCGTVFELSPLSNGWTETVLYRFNGGSDGGYPYSTLAMDGNGNLYGTSYGAPGSGGSGTIFRLSPRNGSWTKTTLHSFTGTPDGGHPEGPVVFDRKGALYGTTAEGGTYGFGTVFELKHHGTGWALKILHSFDSTHGATPAWVQIVVDPAHNLYGTTENGGPNDTGTVWELEYSTTRKHYSEKVLYTFGPKAAGDGNYPWAGMTMLKNGTLYGTTAQGGANNWGTIFSLTRRNHKKWHEAILLSFTGGQDGGQPGGGLLDNGSGNLFGMADGGGTYFTGLVFEITP